MALSGIGLDLVNILDNFMQVKLSFRQYDEFLQPLNAKVMIFARQWSNVPLRIHFVVHMSVHLSVHLSCFCISRLKFYLYHNIPWETSWLHSCFLGKDKIACEIWALIFHFWTKNCVILVHYDSLCRVRMICQVGIALFISLSDEFYWKKMNQQSA